jgi:hypothetical protein
MRDAIAQTVDQAKRDKASYRIADASGEQSTEPRREVLVRTVGKIYTLRKRAGRQGNISLKIFAC